MRGRTRTALPIVLPQVNRMPVFSGDTHPRDLIRRYPVLIRYRRRRQARHARSSSTIRTLHTTPSRTSRSSAHPTRSPRVPSLHTSSSGNRAVPLSSGIEPCARAEPHRLAYSPPKDLWLRVREVRGQVRRNELARRSRTQERTYLSRKTRRTRALSSSSLLPTTNPARIISISRSMRSRLGRIQYLLGITHTEPTKHANRARALHVPHLALLAGRMRARERHARVAQLLLVVFVCDADLRDGRVRRTAEDLLEGLGSFRLVRTSNRETVFAHRVVWPRCAEREELGFAKRFCCKVHNE